MNTTLVDVSLNADEIDMLCNAIRTEFEANKQLTEDYKLQLDVLYNRLQDIFEIIS